MAKVKTASTFDRPRSFVLVSPPGFFTQPKISSMRLRMRWLTVSESQNITKRDFCSSLLRCIH